MEQEHVLAIDAALLRDVLTTRQAAMTARHLLEVGADPDAVLLALEVVERRSRSVSQRLERVLRHADRAVIDLREVAAPSEEPVQDDERA